MNDELKSIDDLSKGGDKITNVTLAENNKFRVAVVNIPKGKKLVPHRAPVDVLIVGMMGNAKVFLGEKTYDFFEGSYLTFPANKVHSVEAKTDFKMLIIK